MITYQSSLQKTLCFLKMKLKIAILMKSIPLSDQVAPSQQETLKIASVMHKLAHH